jgi:hypothetical protein
MRSKLAWTFIIASTVVAASVYEWRYSDDMQDHIDLVNRDLESARLEATFARGLIGSLQTMTAESEVAREIMETNEHVHTVKDEVLARRVKDAAEQGVTVGGAIQNVIARWPGSI